MSYVALRSKLENLQPHISRQIVKTAVLEICQTHNVRVVASGLDPAICRGMYLSPTNTDHAFVRQFGGHVIVIARGLNRCWARFVVVKELMHMLDGEEKATDSGDEFERQLSEMAAPTEGMSPQTISEYRAFWMALGVLCPDSALEPLISKRNAGELSDLQVALTFRIPELYVPLLFHPAYKAYLPQIA